MWTLHVRTLCVNLIFKLQIFRTSFNALPPPSTSDRPLMMTHSPLQTSHPLTDQRNLPTIIRHTAHHSRLTIKTPQPHSINQLECQLFAMLFEYTSPHAGHQIVGPPSETGHLPASAPTSERSSTTTCSSGQSLRPLCDLLNSLSI